MGKAERVRERGEDRSWSERAAKQLRAGKPEELAAILKYAEPPPTAELAEDLAWLDNALRRAARAVELEREPEDALVRTHETLRHEDGSRPSSIEHESLDLVVIAADRVVQALSTDPVLFLRVMLLVSRAKAQVLQALISKPKRQRSDVQLEMEKTKGGWRIKFSATKSKTFK